jgi:hypothetical protein
MFQQDCDALYRQGAQCAADHILDAAAMARAYSQSPDSKTRNRQGWGAAPRPARAEALTSDCMLIA